MTGRGRYAADPAPARLAHLAVRRAGVPAATGLSVDVSRALAMPGVLGAWRAGELGLADPFMSDPGLEPPLKRPVLVEGAVRFEGDAVAVVAALGGYQAQDAAEAVDVDLCPGPLPRPRTAPQEVGFGDLEAAFEGSAVRVRASFAMARVCGAAMEPRAVLAEWLPDEERLVVRASVGWVHGLRDVVAACLGLRPDQVVALADDVGGSFGAKNFAYPEYVMAAAVSRILARPVRWTAGRWEDGVTTGQAHGADIDVEVAADADGRLRGLRAAVEWQAGAYLMRGSMQDRNVAGHVLSAYKVPALSVKTIKAESASAPTAFIRGGGRPIGNFAIERVMDRLARRLGLDPVEVRRRNLVAPSEMPYATGLASAVLDGGDFPRLLEMAVDRLGVGRVRDRQRAGEPLGVGVAMCVESTGFGLPETSRVLVRPDGRVEVVAGTTPQGQGHRTFAAQVAADRLGWPIELVQVVAGDSRMVPASAVTAASRSALELGNSVALSSAAARRRLLELAAERLEVAPEDLVLSPAGCGVRGVPGTLVPLSELVGEGLQATEAWDSGGKVAWASSCHAAVVRLDPETGFVSVLRYVIAHDSGRPINPLLVEGQLHGGYAHGLGYALFEEAAYSDDGVFLSPSFLDYAIVSAPEMACEPELLHIETPSAQNPEGFRGAGEAGTIAVPAAIANAVEDALHARGWQAAVDAVPITPERLWALIRMASA
ncbi:MAG: xanthine dehydrogenase family protein molybdopterin-binding subunit [Candidatus Dormibacterales bacterium]